MLKISVIGKANVVIGDSEPLTFRTHKAEAILYYLIIVSQPVTRAALAELFWPEMSSANAQKNLRAVLPDLRNLLGANLIITPYDLAFNQNSNHTVDLYQLYAILDDASLSDELMLAELLKRYHGELFAGFSVTHSPQFEEWVRNQREATQQKVVHRLQELTERFLYNKAFKAGLDATQMWLTLEPWNELVHRLRMQIFWLSGQRSAALVQYNRCVEYLAEELAVTPSPETKKLYIQIQQNDRSLFEQDARQRSISNRPRHNLPKRFTSFVGREKEIATLLQHLQSGKYPLITISGEGGSGKTRLSIALAERILTEPTRQRYGDGIWFINCANIAADVTTQEHLLIHIGSLLGIEFQSRTSFFQQLVAYLAPRSMLLILDSFEHLSDHGLVLIDLLQQTPNLQILVTSRHDLRLQRTLSMRLEGLDVPLLAKKPLDYALSDSELSQLLQVASVKVFYDRAHIIWPPFTVDKDNAVIIARLCQLLEGNPLALELAATQLNEYDLETLLRELSSSYLLLASDLQDLPPRQRSIYNTLNYSWQLLSPALAELLARCSVFRANFSYQAATAITGASARLITQLINRSLLSNDEQRRVQIHEMVRQFAASKLAQNPTLEAATQKRYAEYFLGLLLQWWEGNESRHWVVQLLPDMNNIYAAWDWAFSHQQFELLSRSMIAFIQFHIYTGQLWDMHLHVNAYYQKLLKQSAQEINTSNAQNYQEMQCALTYGRGIAHYRLGNHERGVELLNEAREQFTQHGYWYLAASVECYLGNFCRQALRCQDAHAYYIRALDYAQQQQQPFALSHALLSLATNTNQQGHPEEARGYLQQAIEILQEYPDITLEATYHGVLADINHAQGHWSEAFENVEKTLEFDFRQARTKMVHEFHTAGKILWQSGRFQQAKEYLERVNGSDTDPLYQPGKYWHTVWLIDFANLYVAWHRPKEALGYCQLALEDAQASAHTVLLARVLKAEGAAQLQLQEWQQSRNSLNQALTLFRQQSAKDHECATLTQLIHLSVAMEERANIAEYCDALLNRLQSSTLDCTNVEPIKAWWACYLGLRALQDARAEWAISNAATLFQNQLAHIHEDAWRHEFSRQIVEHRQLLQTLAAK